MTLSVTAAVLFAAFCHASWNAMIRGGGDKLIGITLMVAAAGLIALPGLFVFPALPSAAVPWLLASMVIHTGYNVFLAFAYHHGELSKVYPLVRGSAPLLTLVVAITFIGEPVSFLSGVGIVVLGLGIMTLALDQGWRVLLALPRGLLYAALTSICIAGYTISDGLGARAAGNAHIYVIWLFVLDSIPLLLGMMALKRRAFFEAAAVGWKAGLGGGLLSLIAYWIVIWAMTVAPIPIVAALRETSILFAAFISMIMLRERLTPARIASILLVVCGLALLRL